MTFITKTLLTVEEKARKFFERIPFIQAFLAGVGVIIFWRGIWEWLDQNNVSPLVSVIIGTGILAGVGVFVQTFLGNTIIIREVRHEERSGKAAVQKIAGEIATEEITLEKLSAKLDQLIEQSKRD